MAGPGRTTAAGGKPDMISSDPDFQALKLMTCMKWMINFEAVASVPNHEDAIFVPHAPRILAS